MFEKLVHRCAMRLARNRRVGWFDYYGGSYDMTLAIAHAWRIACRRKGQRITLAQAINADRVYA